MLLFLKVKKMFQWKIFADMRDWKVSDEHDGLVWADVWICMYVRVSLIDLAHTHSDGFHKTKP